MHFVDNSLSGWAVKLHDKERKRMTVFTKYTIIIVKVKYENYTIIFRILKRSILGTSHNHWFRTWICSKYIIPRFAGPWGCSQGNKEKIKIFRLTQLSELSLADNVLIMWWKISENEYEKECKQTENHGYSSKIKYREH